MGASRYLNLAPRPPPQLVDRVDLCRELIGALTSGGATSVGISCDAALHGFGGFGKTTIAEVACHMPEITSYFKGGILWIVIGENATSRSVAQILSEVMRATGVQLINFTDLHYLKAHARMSVEERVEALGPVLVVFDDVWKWDDLEPYLDPFHCCTRLITTRSIVVARQLDQRVLVDVMTSSESYQMLTKGFKATELLVDTRRALMNLSESLFHWPLLLSISNRLIQRRYKLLQSSNIGSVIDTILREMESDLCALDPMERRTRETAVSQCIAASIKQLNTDEEQYFSMLAVFAEDADIPVIVIRKFWDLPEKQADHLVEKLIETGLLQVCEGSGTSVMRVRLHDVIRSYIVGIRRGDLRVLNHRLLQSYRTDCCDWWDMEEPYVSVPRISLDAGRLW